MTVGYGSLAKVVAPVHAKVPAITVHRLWFGLSFSVHSYPGVSITIVLGRKGLFKLRICSPALKEIRNGSQAKNLETEIDAEAKEECCVLDHSLWFAQLSFLQHQGSPAPGWHFPQWTRSFHIIINQENPPLSFAHRPIIMRAFSQLRFPLFKWLLLVSNWHKTR